MLPCRWLHKSHPPLPPSVVAEVIKTHRQEFTVAQTRVNLARVKRGIRVLRHVVRKGCVRVREGFGGGLRDVRGCCVVC